MSFAHEESVGRIVVAGVGNDFRMDDGAGLVALRRLKDLRFPHVRSIELREDLTKLLEVLDGARQVYILDAVRSGAPPGTVHRVEVSSPEFTPERFPSSTHGVTLPTLSGLIQLQAQHPVKVVLYGIEGERFGYGDALSDPVRAAIDVLIGRLSRELEQAAG